MINVDTLLMLHISDQIFRIFVCAPAIKNHTHIYTHTRSHSLSLFLSLPVCFTNNNIGEFPGKIPHWFSIKILAWGRDREMLCISTSKRVSPLLFVGPNLLLMFSHLISSRTVKKRKLCKNKMTNASKIGSTSIRWFILWLEWISLAFGCQPQFRSST